MPRPPMGTGHGLRDRALCLDLGLDLESRRMECKVCGLKQEKLSFLSPNASYSERFVVSIGKRCRAIDQRYCPPAGTLGVPHSGSQAVP
jgi:hypothetical protein